jgi:hypothetical protein
MAWASGDISTTGNRDGLGFAPRSASGVFCEHVNLSNHLQCVTASLVLMYMVLQHPLRDDSYVGLLQTPRCRRDSQQ